MSDARSKKCHKCGKVKSLSAFYSQPDTKFGVANVCKSCVKRKVDAWQKDHPSKVNQKNRTWYHKTSGTAEKVVKARIFLGEGQSQEEAEELLLKALSAQHRGDTHSHAFPDPGVDHVSETMKRKHQEMIQRLVKEITEILEMP